MPGWNSSGLIRKRNRGNRRKKKLNHLGKYVYNLRNWPLIKCNCVRYLIHFILPYYECKKKILKSFYFMYVGIDRGFVIPKWLDYAIPPLPLKIFKFKTLILDIQKVHLNKSQWLESLSSFRFTFLSNVMSTINEGNSEAFGNLWNIIFDCNIW